MTVPKCPCGEDHSGQPAYQELLVLIEELGECTPVRLLGENHETLVPRLYIAYHGFKGSDVAGLAEKYGWKTQAGVLVDHGLRRG